VNILPRGYL